MANHKDNASRQARMAGFGAFAWLRENKWVFAVLIGLILAGALLFGG